jgi:hypothetical protein
LPRSRFLGLVGFSNDQYVSLTGAQQMLLGDLPTRDFLDPGLPLMYAASAGAQLLFGRKLFAEAMLVSGAFRIHRPRLTIVAVSRADRLAAGGNRCGSVRGREHSTDIQLPEGSALCRGPLFMWLVRAPAVACAAGGTRGIHRISRFSSATITGSISDGGGVAAVAFATGTGIHRRLSTRVGAFAALVGLGLLPYLLYLAVHGSVLDVFCAGLGVQRCRVGSERR